MKETDFIFIDLETTGLDPDKHEIIEIAALHAIPSVSALGKLELLYNTMMATRVAPRHIETADPEALAVNGYDGPLWAMAPSLYEALHMLKRFVSDHRSQTTTTGEPNKVILAGHNVGFDIAFLQRAWREFPDTCVEHLSHHRLDTVSLALPLLIDRRVERLSLAPLCQFLRIEHEEAHRAVADVEATFALANRLLRIYSSSIDAAFGWWPRCC